MKLNKEMLLSRMDNITEETKKFSTGLTNKAKNAVANTKEVVSNKLENMESKPLISQDDMVKILDGIYDNVINGLGNVSPSVETFANDYLEKNKDSKEAAKKMLNNQIVKCATSGFITGFGGAITLPITIPANISSVLYVQIRMIACTAYMAGYDLKSDQVQTLVYACLAGVSVSQVVKQTGVKIGMKMANSAIKKIPGKTLTKINQKVGFRFITKFGSKGAINLGKLVPGVGGVIGGSLDYVETKTIAKRAYDWFFEGEFDKGVIETTEEVELI